MRTLTEIRAAIDAADTDILAALNRRFALSAEMRALKAREGLPCVDAAREGEILARVAATAAPADRDTACAIYETILGGSRGAVEIVARGVAVRDGRILLCRARDGDAHYLPGGHVDFGETGREALVREVREELGVGSRCGRFLGVLENTFLQHDKRHCEVNLVYELFLEGDGNVSSQENWIAFDWCPLDDLNAAQLLPEAFRTLSRWPDVSFAP